MKTLSTQSGFTLIELLVVVSIISLLSSILMVSTANARKKARLVQRKQTLQQLAKALELYYGDHGQYPITPNYILYASEVEANMGAVLSPDNYIPELVPKYISKLPKDPLGGMSPDVWCVGGWHRSYLYISDGRDYKIMALCSQEGLYDPADPMNDPARDGGPMAWTAGANHSTPESSSISPSNPRSCDNPPQGGTVDLVVGGDKTYGWSYAVYSSARSKCW